MSIYKEVEEALRKCQDFRVLVSRNSKTYPELNKLLNQKVVPKVVAALLRPAKKPT